MAQPVEQSVDLPGQGRTVVLDVPGPPGAPVLLLLHGIGATARLNWGLCFRPLSRHFRILAPDHRGHGRGLRTERFRLEECADDAMALADALGVKHLIAVGYSMGGPIASLAWRRYPRRVDGLVLCATARHFVPRGFTGLARATMPLAVRATRMASPVAFAVMLRRMTSRIGNSTLRARVEEELSGHDPTTIVQAAEALTHFSSHDWIGEVDVPAAVVVTTRDRLVPPGRQRKLAAAIPGARIFEVQDDHDACVHRGGFAEALLHACEAVAHEERA
jgi:pimeloyl-ACP methyl ester carboxylesterase